MKQLLIIFLLLAMESASAQVQQRIPNNTVLGNFSGGPAAPSALTASTTNTGLLAPALLAIGGTADDTAAVQAIIATVPATNGVLKFSPGVVYKIGAAGLSFTNYTNLEVDFNGAQIQGLADSTLSDGVGSFARILFTNCTNCKVHGGNYNGQTFGGGFLGFVNSTDDEIFANYSTNVKSTTNFHFGSNKSTRLRWHDNTAVGAVVFFNGTITGASGTSATLTVNSTQSGTVATSQTLSPAVEGNSQTTTITGGSAPTFTITCSVACVNVSASNMISAPTGFATRGFWLGNSNAGFIDTDEIIGPNNKAIGNTATGFALEAAGAQVFNNYANGNFGAGFISSTATGSQSVDQSFVGNTAINNTFHGYQTDVANGVPVLRVTLSGNKFASNAGACIYLSNAQYFTVTGNTCTKNDTAVQPVQEILLALNSNNVSIIGNTLLPNTNTNDAGIGFNYGAAAVLSDITISGNTITCPANTAGFGIVANSANSSTTQRISVTGNNISTCNTGMTFRATAAGDTYNDVTVMGNTVFNVTFPIRFSSSTANQLTNARVIGNSGGIFQDANTLLSAVAGNVGASTSNAVYGFNAGSSITSGSNNVAIGNSVASTVLTTGSNNILIGASSAVTTLAAGTSNEVNIGGLLFYNNASLAAPAVSACGTSPAIDPHANNKSGTVTVGSGTVSSCTVTFAGSGYSTWDHCRVTPHTTIAAFGYSYTTTVLTLTATSLTSDVVDYDCDGV